MKFILPSKAKGHVFKCAPKMFIFSELKIWKSGLDYAVVPKFSRHDQHMGLSQKHVFVFLYSQGRAYDEQNMGFSRKEPRKCRNWLNTPKL